MYGIIYCGFIFADRLVATITTVGTYSLLSGDIFTDYQDSMDLALLILLIIVPLVEYFSYKLIIFWYDRAKNMTLAEVDSLAWRLTEKILVFTRSNLLVVWTINVDYVDFDIGIASRFK